MFRVTFNVAPDKIRELLDRLPESVEEMQIIEVQGTASTRSARKTYSLTVPNDFIEKFFKKDLVNENLRGRILKQLGEHGAMEFKDLHNLIAKPEGSIRQALGELVRNGVVETTSAA